jgi:uncharacterized protein (TIGR00730 family)
MSRLHKNKEYFSNVERTVEQVRDEINGGLALLNKIDQPIVTFFGSHRVLPGSLYYEHAKNVACELGKRGHAILSGGGPGIMHAVNSGAMEVAAVSVGLPAALLKGEKVTDPIFTYTFSFHFLLARRFIMSIKSEALVFYPGGYGTLNELFEYAVLMQTDILDTVPIICVGREYWQGLFSWLKEHPLKKDFLIHDVQDIELLYFVEDTQEILTIIEKKRHE